MATSAYPPPPPFYRLYKDYEQDPSSAPEPPPPIDGKYEVFGVTREVCCLLYFACYSVFYCALFFIVLNFP